MHVVKYAKIMAKPKPRLNFSKSSPTVVGNVGSLDKSISNWVRTLHLITDTSFSTPPMLRMDLCKGYDINFKDLSVLYFQGKLWNFICCPWVSATEYQVPLL